MSALLVVLGAAVGAPLRYLVDRELRRRHPSTYPWGTFAVNVGGSLVLGLVAGLAASAGVSQSVQLLVGTGFCGALSTYSTFSYEVLRLGESGARRVGLGYVVASVLGALAAAALGYLLGAR